MKSLKDFENVLQEYINLFEELETREQLQIILELGQELDEFPEEFKSLENKVRGCISDAYIALKLEEDGSIKLYGTSDALIVKGYIALLIEAISGLKLKDVQDIDTKLEEFAIKTKIKATLSQSRSSAFGNIILMIKEQAKNLKIN